MPVRQRGLIPIAAIGLIISCSGCSKQNATAASAPPVAPVKVAVAETRTLPIEIRAIGNVEPYKTISVKSQQTGTLIRVDFKEGDAVNKGQLLFEIDPRPFQESVHQIEANLARDTALLNQADANLARDTAQEKFSRDQAKRYAELAKQGVFSREQSDQANSTAESQTAALTADRAAIESARSAIAADNAALANAKLQLSYCSIYSAVSGRTGNIAVKEGNLVKATDIELVSIAQIHPVYAAFTVPEKQLADVRQRMSGGTLAVTAVPQGSTAGPVEAGALTFVDNAVDQATGTIKLKATFNNAGSRLWPGQFVDVVLTLGRKPGVITIPTQAIQIGQAGRYVFVVKQDETVEMRSVSIGESVAGMAEVLQGVAAGERVVTDGHIRLATGSRVRVQS